MIRDMVYGGANGPSQAQGPDHGLILAEEPASGLATRFRLLDEQAPANTRFLRALLREPKAIPGLHAMWTGPEISCPVPLGMIPEDARAALPAENATIHPQPGDLVLAYLPPRLWGGGPEPVFDLGLFYGPGARMFFPVGWLPGSVVARAEPPEAIAALARACGSIRRAGACTIRFSLVAA
jgi:hypothetical protein